MDNELFDSDGNSKLTTLALKVGIYNVNAKVEDKNYTAEDARNAVPANIRKKGLIIAYKTADATWVTEQYIQEYPSSNTWTTDSYWIRIATSKDISSLKSVVDGRTSVLNVNILIPLESGVYTLATAIAALWDNADTKSLCKKGAIITFYNSDNDWNIYQYKGGENIIQESDWKRTTKWTLRTRPQVMFVPASAGIDGINTALWTYPNGCTIELEEGTYTGSDALIFTNGGSAVCSNCVIVGKGVNTIISRTSGNDLVARVGSNNIIKNCNFVHGTLITSASNVILSQCIVNGKYKDDTQKSCYDIKVAAYNSTDTAKMNADIIAGETDAQTAIQTAIDSLTSGGSVFLASGMYNLSAYINLKGKSNISIKGCGYGTYLYRSEGYAVMANDTTSNCCMSEVRMNNYSLGSNVYCYNIWKNDDFIDVTPDSLADIVVKPSQGIAGINTAIASLTNGGKVSLEVGEYTGTTGIQFTTSNVIVEGQGAKTVINRTTGGNDVFSNTTTASGNILRNVKLTNTYQQNGDYPTQRYRLEDCIVGGNMINETTQSNVIVNIGNSFFYKSVKTVYDIVSAHNWIYKNRFEFHVHGHIIETIPLYFCKPIDLIGHNALIEMHGSKTMTWIFQSPYSGTGTSYYMLAEVPNKVKDIHFIKTGCYAYRDAPCVTVLSKDTIFENCIFENATSSPVPFNNAEWGISAESPYGCRRHGIVVDIMSYGMNCLTRFVNCVGIGSPYGFQSTRGWYIAYGSPKLYNCIGYGGGIGEYGHGIINHRASQAELFDCVGYASANSFRLSAGIRYQAHGSSNLNNCVGYGSNGEKYKSEGVSKERLLDLCETLGITDTSFFINNDETVNYEGLALTSERTPAESDDGYDASRKLLCDALTNDDVTLTALNSGVEESYGISFWANSGRAKLVGCKGYCGSGDNSHGLHIIAAAMPTVMGGLFGSEEKMHNTEWVSGSSMTFGLTGLNSYTKYKIKNVCVTTTSVFTDDAKFYLETEDGSVKVVDGFQMKGISSIIRCGNVNVSVPAGKKLKAYVMSNGSQMSLADSRLNIHILWEFDSDNSSALYISDTAEPTITNAMLVANDNSKAIESTVSNIKVFDCAIDGDVDSSVTFASKEMVNNSSNYNV